jgi:hypothetical protein
MIIVSTYSASLLQKKNVRLFHPSFPLKIKYPLENLEISKLETIKNQLKNSSLQIGHEKLKKLPWKSLPDLGVSSMLEKDVFSEKEIELCYENDKHNGYLVWAEKISNPKKGCYLLNHWKQQVINVTDYSVEEGAKGYEIILGKDSKNSEIIYWPPFTLEMEISKDLWQPVEVSENLINGEVFRYFPSQMTSAPWEIIFLLLLSHEDDDEIFQTLFDTGLSPKQGFFAYLRLLDLMTKRTSVWTDIPSYRKVFETNIQF